MKPLLLIILISILQLSCSKKNSDTAFLNGEWMSDSLKVKNNDHWREFLHFKNGKLLAQTTWWGKNYVLNKNLDIQNNKFTDAKGNTYSINIIDSLTIEVKGNEYYGRFIKEQVQSEDIDTAINEFEQAQKNRNQLIGNWKIIKLEKKLRSDADQKDPINQEFLKSTEFEKLLDIPTSSINHINLDLENFTIHLKNEKNYQYPYVLGPESFELFSEDMIFNLKYKIESPQQFRIKTYNTAGIYIDIIFAKQ
ncbi:hypothetical protein [Chryseobacterium sp. BIGb0232]|uniref:hypothetical protein n=1 Tax=Chryseobacterium sp. BIGb0232 TaxID=2940598 RepID=UPI000F47783B|nr:hypothetical protein [Chryseobacterium sp. BIGb0232]MCS4303284.1 hypothetical protein [Chryseobacterium sp. BIGb0232]ROS11441.1 hypothetical protein EDF65_3853 [Chryseobacterium nakagawai]